MGVRSNDDGGRMKDVDSLEAREGTMGGLVQDGRQIARHVKAAIDLGRLCSNDPVCAQHMFRRSKWAPL